MHCWLCSWRCAAPTPSPLSPSLGMHPYFMPACRFPQSWCVAAQPHHLWQCACDPNTVAKQWSPCLLQLHSHVQCLPGLCRRPYAVPGLAAAQACQLSQQTQVASISQQVPAPKHLADLQAEGVLHAALHPSSCSLMEGQLMQPSGGLKHGHQGSGARGSMQGSFCLSTASRVWAVCHQACFASAAYSAAPQIGSRGCSPCQEGSLAAAAAGPDSVPSRCRWRKFQWPVPVKAVRRGISQDSLAAAGCKRG